MTTRPTQAFTRRVWNGYVRALKERPIRTRMISSCVLYIIGDSVAQFGVEEKRLFSDPKDVKKQYDVARLLRMTFYGTFLFAPLGHFWLSGLERIHFASKLGTFLTRITLDACVWSPWVGLMFPTSMGVLEGRNFDQIQTKIKATWWPTYSRAICVFFPTQVINFTLVPPHLRLLLLQSVGLCWNVYLSWFNNWNNKRLAEAEAALTAAAGDVEIQAAQDEVQKREATKEKIQSQGKPDQVGVRMGWA